MMLGEMDFVGTYVQPFYNRDLPLPIPTFCLLCEFTGPFGFQNIHFGQSFECIFYHFPGLFMILMPILLMNLLIGLAVGDIESVRRNAQLKRLAMQVVLHTELERKLPQIWLERADRTELIEYPNNQKCKIGMFDMVLRRWFCNPFNDDSKPHINSNVDKLRLFAVENTSDIFCLSEQVILTLISIHPKRLLPTSWRSRGVSFEKSPTHSKYSINFFG